MPLVPKDPNPTKRKGLSRLLPPGVCVGLALGGGAARALAHIGVIKVLTQARIPIHIISGCSFGALVGGCYAANGDIHEFENQVINHIDSDDFRKKAFDSLRQSRDKGEKFNFSRFLRKGVYYSRLLLKQSFFSKEEYAHDLKAVIPDVQIKAMPLIFGCNAVDIHSGHEKEFASGPLQSSIMASCAIPGIFPPITLEGRTYIDGGWVNSIPVSLARKLGSDFVIAVDVSYTVETRRGFTSGMDVIARGAQIKSNRLAEFSRQEADAVIHAEVDDIAWVDFMRAREIIERGETAARKALPHIASLLRRQSWKQRIPFRRQLMKILK